MERTTIINHPAAEVLPLFANPIENQPQGILLPVTRSVPEQEEELGTTNLPFIEANTKAVTSDHLKSDCIIPVFSKDNEVTISHQSFIAAVQERLAHPVRTHLYPSGNLEVSVEEHSNWLRCAIVKPDGTRTASEQFYWLHNPDNHMLDGPIARDMVFDTLGNLYVLTPFGIRTAAYGPSSIFRRARTGDLPNLFASGRASSSSTAAACSSPGI